MEEICDHQKEVVNMEPEEPRQEQPRTSERLYEKKWYLYQVSQCNSMFDFVMNRAIIETTCAAFVCFHDNGYLPYTCMKNRCIGVELYCKQKAEEEKQKANLTQNS
jgi:hypothetical protein